MPRPLLPKNLSAEMRVGTAARRIIRAKVDEVEAFVKLAMAGDEDGIHDMRVAVKRMREALRLFRGLIRGKHRRAVLPLVEELNDALGAVRERDVLIRDASEIIEQIPAGADLLGELIERWADQRKRAHTSLLAVWRRMSREEEILDHVLRAGRSAGRHRALNDLSLERFAYVAVTARAAGVVERLGEARGTDDPAHLHALRIAVKKLKYTVEPFLPVFPALQASYDLVADIQECLGVTHDLDVLLSAFQECLRGHDHGASEAAEDVLAIMRERREHHYSQAHAYVDALDDQTWRHILLDSID